MHLTSISCDKLSADASCFKVKRGALCVDFMLSRAQGRGME